MSEYRVEFYDNNPYQPSYVDYMTEREVYDIIAYYKGAFDYYVRRKVGGVIYYEFFNNSDTDELYIVISES